MQFKKSYIIILSLMVYGLHAQASRARLSALGQSTNGSYFIKDDRNIFLNPSVILDLPQQVNFEMGSSTSTHKGEGGFISTLDSAAFGVQLGRLGTGAQHILSAETDNSLSLENPQNSIELIYGRALSQFNLGMSLHYSTLDKDTGPTNNLPDSSANVLSAQFGMSNSNMNLIVYYGINEKSRTDDLASSVKEYRGTSSLKFGGSYNFSELQKASAEVSQYAYSYNNGSGKTGSASVQNIDASYFNQFQTSKPDLFLFFIAGLNQTKKYFDLDAISASDEESVALNLPLSLGAETKMKEWFSVRASVKQYTVINSNDYKNGSSDLKTNNALDTTSIAAGVTFDFGELSLDGTLEGATTGTINGNSLISNASLKYKF